MPDDNGNLIWIQLRIFIMKYSAILLIGMICLIVICCYCYVQRLEYGKIMMSRQRRLHPPHSLVIRMSKKNRVPYRKGFKTNTLPLTDPHIVTINPAPMPVQSIPESFVQEGPVHITPTPPPKPVPFFVCYKQTTLYEFE